MFHIKTDIRQYKCESADKVERLIRNWVIRPSDLIYNATEKTWNPIGQHPAFDDIFAGIEKEEANEPDTIVTEAPSEVAAEHEVEPGAELDSDEVAADEATNVSPAPSAAAAPETNTAANTAAAGTPSIVIDAEQATLAADSEEITNVTEAPSAESSANPAETEDEITDVREDPRRDTDEQDAADAPIPPEPSDDVEGLIRDSDEITMMTDKTFEMLSAESDKKASKSDVADSESVTSDAQADRDDQTSDDVSPDEQASDEDPGAGETSDLQAQPSEETSETSDEDREEESAEESSPEKANTDKANPDKANPADEPGKSSGGGRHGLPEEVFVTDEIPRQDVQQAVLDELGELEEDVEPDEEDDEVTELLDRDADSDLEEGEERKSRWRIVMSDDADADEQDDHEAVVEDTAVEDASAEDTSVEDTAEADSSDKDEKLEDGGAPPEEQSDETSADDDLDDMLDEAAELVGLGEGTDPIDIDGGALEPIGDDEDDGRERADTPVRAVAEPKEFVSEGYKLPLPVDISPSTEDIRLGLKHSRVGKAIKDATFPYPKPKMRDEVTTRTFDLDPEEPADHSVLIVAAFLVGLLIITIAAVTLLG